MDSGGRHAHDRPDGRARELDKQNDDRQGIDRRTARPVPGRYPRPDKRQRAFLPGVQCEACKCVGHEAANRDMLAVALFVDWYTKADLSAADHSNIEQCWLSRWNEELCRPARTPRQVMRTYCQTYNISEDDVDQAMDWECWPVEYNEQDLK